MIIRFDFANNTEMKFNTKVIESRLIYFTDSVFLGKATVIYSQVRIIYMSIGNNMMYNVILHQIVIASYYYACCDQCEYTRVLRKW